MHSQLRRRIVVIPALVGFTAVIVVLAVVLSQRSNGGSSTTASSLEGRATTSAPSSSMSPTMSPFPSSSPSPSKIPTDTPSISPTSGPTITARPTDTPSQSPSLEPSPQPSGFPSSAPSISPVPSSKPSSAPSFRPTLQPSGEPTDIPSSSPSYAPSFPPSVAPSNVPTLQPSPSPSLSPSLSFSPTFGPISEDFAFRIKMNWESGFYWQESNKEVRYCMECCQCVELYFSQWPNCRPASCAESKQIWIQKCQPGGSGGEYFNVKWAGPFILIKLEKKSLCLTRREKHVLTLQTCDADDTRQLWKPISAGTKFELSPAYLGSHDDSPYCLTQHHHPKPGELVGFKRCTQGHKYDTGYWVTY